MPDTSAPSPPVRPDRIRPRPVPPVPDLSKASPDDASVGYSHYRTGLSNHRTGLSEHRTDLSEFRTDLSTERTEMSMRRTGMSFQRTRMSADRTLMSVIRTSLSLIGFGFTIYQTFEKLRDAAVVHSAAAPRNFGLTLIVLGMLILIGGIVQHAGFSRELRHTRMAMKGEGLIYGQSSFPVSAPLVVAIALLIVGLVAALSIVFRVSLFG